MQYHNETPRSCAAWEAVVDGGSVDKDPAGRGAEIELTDGSPFDRLPDLGPGASQVTLLWSQAAVGGGRSVGWWGGTLHTSGGSSPRSWLMR
jgi:hypothetical protein